LVVAANVVEVCIGVDYDAVGFREVLEDERDNVAGAFEEVTPRTLYADRFLIVLEYEHFSVVALRGSMLRILTVHRELSVSRIATRISVFVGDEFELDVDRASGIERRGKLRRFSDLCITLGLYFRGFTGRSFTLSCLLSLLFGFSCLPLSLLFGFSCLSLSLLFGCNCLTFSFRFPPFSLLPFFFGSPFSLLSGFPCPPFSFSFRFCHHASFGISHQLRKLGKALAERPSIKAVHGVSKLTTGYDEVWRNELRLMRTATILPDQVLLRRCVSRLNI